MIFFIMITLKIISSKEYENLRRKKFLISYAFEKSHFGECLIGLHGSSICHLSFVNSSQSKNLNVLKQQWPGAELIFSKTIAHVATSVFNDKNRTFEVLLKGTIFEGKVWNELVKIPRGSTVCYESIAISIGHDKAVRAVANAVAKNPVSYLVPCHRVIRKDGSLHKYQWGPEVKKRILEYEDCFFK